MNAESNLIEWPEVFEGDDSQAWLKIFRDDEPNVIFIACKRMPKD